MVRSGNTSVMSWVVRVLALQLFAVPLAVFAGRAVIHWGGEWNLYEWVQVIVNPLLFSCGLYSFIVWPIYHFGWRELSSMRIQALKGVVLFSLILLPVGSFVFLHANVRNGLHFYEMVLLVVPSILIGVICLMRLENPLLSSLLTAIPICLGLYVVSDIFGPFTARAQYLSDGYYVLVLRSLCAGCAVFISFREIGQKPSVPMATHAVSQQKSAFSH